MKKALVLGATGLIGGHVLSLLLEDERYENVTVIGRRTCGINHKKLTEKLGDLFKLEDFVSEFQDGDDLFIAIGTTNAKTPDNDIYSKIDHDIPVAAVSLANTAGFKNVVVVSSMGANPKSRIFYAALKGRMEEDVLQIPIENLTIVRPSLLLGDRNEKRAMEKFSAVLMTTFNFIIPKKHKAILGKDVAKAMIVLANVPFKKHIWMNNELQELAKEYSK